MRVTKGYSKKLRYLGLSKKDKPSTNKNLKCVLLHNAYTQEKHLVYNLYTQCLSCV